MKTNILVFMILFHSLLGAAKEPTNSNETPDIQPDNTFLFIKKDSCELFLDLYKPKSEIDSSTDKSTISEKKPTILFMFGGGFIYGNKADADYLPWFKKLSEDGYTVVSIDYRLGLKGVKGVGIAQVKAIDKAIRLAVEDLYSATNFIIENAEDLEIDPNNIILAGSSAGAISVLQAEYERSNRTDIAKVLPEDFKYAGVISFAGAILSFDGKLTYNSAPAPTLMLHGTKDKVVNYGQTRFFNIGFFGSKMIAERYAKFGYNYNFLRFLDNQHEIAISLMETYDYQIDFINKNIINKEARIVDALIQDPSIKKGSTVASLDELYD